MALTALQKTLKAEEMKAILNRNPRLAKLDAELRQQNAKIDAMIDRITIALENDDLPAAFSEFPKGAELLAASEPQKSETRKAISSKIRPFNS